VIFFAVKLENGRRVWLVRSAVELQVLMREKYMFSKVIWLPSETIRVSTFEMLENSMFLRFTFEQEENDKNGIKLYVFSHLFPKS